MKKISVIVPFYNTAKYIERCLDSILNQNFDSYEVLLINDGSNDESTSIALNYSKKYKNIIKYYKKTNGGLSSARNLGLKKSSGKYIMFVDSDDYIEHKTLKNVYKEISKTDSDIVVFDYYQTYINKKVYLNTFIKKGFISTKDYLLLPTCAWNKIYKKEFLDSINYEYPEGFWYEDIAVNHSLCIYTSKIYYIKKPFYNYIQRKGSIMNQNDFNPKMFDLIKMIHTMEKTFKKNNLYKKYKDEIEYFSIQRYLKMVPTLMYKYDKEDKKNLEIFVEEIRNNYPNWRNNPYYKKEGFSQKLKMNLVYGGNYNIFCFLYKIVIKYIKFN